MDDDQTILKATIVCVFCIKPSISRSYYIFPYVMVSFSCMLKFHMQTKICNFREPSVILIFQILKDMTKWAWGMYILYY